MTNSENKDEPEAQHPTENSSRRDFLRKSVAGAAAVTGAAAGLTAAGGSMASAANSPRQLPTPPPVGAEIPCSCLALNTPLTVQAATLTVDFRGEIRIRVSASNPLDPWSLRLKVIGHRVRAQDDTLGEITIEQADTEVTPDSLLTMVSQYPPRWEQTMFLDFTLTIERPPEETMRRALGVQPRQSEPLVLTTKNPGKLVGQLSEFPPRGELYRLQNPIDLVLPDNPDETIASIDKFPVKVGGL
jgi:hypothetical protein